MIIVLKKGSTFTTVGEIGALAIPLREWKIMRSRTLSSEEVVTLRCSMSDQV